MDYENITLTFDDETGKLHYTNVQGEKEITFRMCQNEYGLFPEEGYSVDVGTVFYRIIIINALLLQLGWGVSKTNLSIDETAFMIFSESSQIVGNGFRVYK